jgi:hypothetical protein
MRFARSIRASSRVKTLGQTKKFGVIIFPSASLYIHTPAWIRGPKLVELTEFEAYDPIYTFEKKKVPADLTVRET